MLFGVALAGPAIAGDPSTPGAFHLVQPISFPVLPELRIRVAVAPTDAGWRSRDDGNPVRRGVGGALVDVFPFDEHFRLSAGGKLFSRAPARSPDPEILQGLPVTRVPGARAGRRFSPAMLMGYSRTTLQGVALGLDAGVLVGQTDPAPEFRLKRSAGPRPANGLNGLARMTVSYRF